MVAAGASAVSARAACGGGVIARGRGAPTEEERLDGRAEEGEVGVGAGAVGRSCMRERVRRLKRGDRSDSSKLRAGEREKEDRGIALSGGTITSAFEFGCEAVRSRMYGRRRRLRRQTQKLRRRIVVVLLTVLCASNGIEII
jgi:hypothetical protein